jgi:hypothetical protein
MNKRILTVAVCALIGVSSAFAQNDYVKDENINVGVEADDLINNANDGKLNKQNYDGWYNHVQGSAANLGVRYTRITNATLFPDTLVYQLYGSAGGGTELGKTSTHSLGEIFYPQDSSIYLEDPSQGIPSNLSRYNPYVVDSIQLVWRYAHNVPGSVDTLLVQFYGNDKIDRVSLSGSQRATATLDYSKSGNRGADPTSEVIILLTEDDTSDWADNSSFNGRTIAIPNGGLNIPADGIAGYTISFIPGFDYAEGDTIEFDWEGGEPTKKLNHYIAATFQDQDKVMEAFRSYGTGLTANRLSRYTSSTWNNRYIPGTAWFDYDMHQNMAYHVTTQNFGVPVIERIPLAVYPNPVTNNSKLYVSADVPQEYTTLEIMDQSGRVVGVYERPVAGEGVDVNLSAGVYFVKFIGQNSVVTNRLVVE